MRAILASLTVATAAALLLASCASESETPGCADGTRNGIETGLDCGGGCPPCPDGEGCAGASDCRSAVCTGGACAAATCSDQVRNGAESDVDCGGGCAGCAPGGGCATGADCESGVCAAGACRAAECGDGVRNGAETDVDCGGGCGPCPDGDACLVAGDCQSAVCLTAICQTPTCSDGAANGQETDVDCGGATCAPCAVGEDCQAATDCAEQVCQAGTCRPASCGDGLRNGEETDVDCGGSACGPCAVGEGCALHADCESGVCQSALCRPASCGDGEKNGEETDVDCGGATCGPCSAGLACGAPVDCASGLCVGQRCLLGPGAPCGDDALCASGFCADGVCCDARCGGTCERCDLVATRGLCSAVPAGQDPDEDCAAEAASTCGRTGACSGARTCQLHASGTVCAPAQCPSSTTSSLADTCNGAGACVDRGTQGCGAYTCNPASGLCRTACTAAIDCAAGHACSGGRCVKVTGQPCSSGGECLSGYCCGGLCRDVTADPANCGGCGIACTNPSGTTSCSGGLCNPVCNAGYASCDGNRNNGCETSTRTTSNCGGCGVACNYAHAYESCATGSCTLTACEAAWASCDGIEANGCELSLGPSNGCDTSEYAGYQCGDTQCGFMCPSNPPTLLGELQGTSARWYMAVIDECSTCSASVWAGVQLEVPPGIDYDLYVYRDSCGGSPWASSAAGTGQPEDVSVSVGDGAGGNDGFYLLIEVRYYSGVSCQPYTLRVYGRDC